MHMVLPLSTSSQEVSCIEPPKLPPHRKFMAFYNPYLHVPPHKNTNINRYFIFEVIYVQMLCVIERQKNDHK